MMRPHCDRCDELCDGYQSWTEDNESPLDARGKPMVGSGANPIWHIEINSGGEWQIPDEKRMFCRACRIAILEAHVKELKLQKAPSGGHLADCKWDYDSGRYACAEGCEIKRINKSSTYDERHQFPIAYGECARCGVSQRIAVGTSTVPGVRCNHEDS